jgi:hypothetical protein
MRSLNSLAVIGAVVLAAAAQQPAAAPAAPAAGAVTADIQIGKSVANHMVADTGSAFPADVGTLVAWTAVTGAGGTAIKHVWAHGPHADTVTLNIGGSPWRTYSRKTIPAEWTGQWTLTVLDASGAVVATKTFTVGS